MTEHNNRQHDETEKFEAIKPDDAVPPSDQPTELIYVRPDTQGEAPVNNTSHMKPYDDADYFAVESEDEPEPDEEPEFNPEGYEEPEYDDEPTSSTHEDENEPEGGIRGWYHSLTENQQQLVKIGGAVGAILLLVVGGTAVMTSANNDDTELPNAYVQTPYNDNDNDGDRVDNDDYYNNSDQPDRNRNYSDDDPNLDRSRDESNNGSENNDEQVIERPRDNSSDKKQQERRENLMPHVVPENDEPRNDWINEGPSAQNSAEMDKAASDVSFSLDHIVNNPTPNNSGYKEVNDMLAQQGLRAGGTIQNSYQMMQYITDGDANVFVSRASKPDMKATGTAGVYELQYRVAASVLPLGENDDKDALTSRLQRQMDNALMAGVGVPVSFIIDFNENVVEVNPERWW